MNDDLFNPNAKLNSIMKKLGLQNCIEKATRITETSESMIDLIISNRIDYVKEWEVEPCVVADHELISAVINIAKPKRQPEYRTYRCQSNYSPNDLCNLILEQASYLNTITNTDDVDTQVQVINNVLNTCINNCAPLVTKVITRPPAPWMTEALKQAIKECKELYL